MFETKPIISEAIDLCHVDGCYEGSLSYYIMIIITVIVVAVVLIIIIIIII